MHPEFRKTFSINKKVKNAKIYICGLGIFETYLGDKKIGNDLLAPFINDYEEHYQYCTYDVTELLETDNTWTVLLGDGWYRGHFGLGEPTHYERPLALIAELRICYEDETVEVITTDVKLEIFEPVYLLYLIFTMERYRTIITGKSLSGKSRY